MARDSSLWMGGVEKYMTEKFLKNAFSLSLTESSVISVKVIRNKFTGERASYAYINFDSDAAALMAMHRLTNKMVPHSQPPVRFQLSHASDKQTGNQYAEREYSIWVSDLPGNISEEEFHKAFSSRFDSIKTAKLFKEKDNKVYGFVRFTDMNDQRDALIHMDGFLGLGPKPIRVALAIPKRSLAEATNKLATKYSEMYESYDQSSNYGAYQGSNRPILVSSTAPTATGVRTLDDILDNDDSSADENEAAQDEYRVIDHSAPLNVDAMNTDYINKSNEVWDGIEKDRWLYNLDGDEGILPKFKKNNRKRAYEPTVDEED